MLNCCVVYCSDVEYNAACFHALVRFYALCCVHWTCTPTFMTSFSMSEGHLAVFTGKPHVPKQDTLRVCSPLPQTPYWFKKKASGNIKIARYNTVMYTYIITASF